VIRFCLELHRDDAPGGTSRAWRFVSTAPQENEDMRGRRVAACVTLTVLASAVALAQGRGGGGQRAVPSDVRAAAESGLAQLLGPDSARGLDRLGFRNRAEATDAKIGDGFQVFTVQPDLLAASETADISSAAAPSTQWLFLVTSGGAPRSILTVDQVGGVWTAVSIGGAEMSEALATLLARWPTSTYSHRFIRSYEAAAEMMEVSRGGRVLGAVPFRSAGATMRTPGRFDPNDLRPTGEISAQIRPAAKAAVQRKR
jgi:hypothetical protein